MESGKFTENPNSQPTSFNEQFQVKKIDLGNKTVDTVDISPTNTEGNPVGFFLGWGGQIKDCGPFYQGFFDHNKRVISTQYPTEKPTVKKEDLPEGYTEQGYRNAVEFVETIIEKGITRLDLVGHSRGAGVMLIANELLLASGVQVDNLILVNGTGFEDLNLRTSIKRLSAMNNQEKERAKNNPEFAEINKKLGIETLKLILRHPVDMLREGLDISKVDLSSLLTRAYLREQHIGIIQTGDDPITTYNELGFGVAKTQQQIRLEQIEKLKEKYPDMLSDKNQSTAFFKNVSALNTNEQESPLIVTIPEDEGAGHLFNGFYPGTYAPLAADMLNYFRTGEIPEAA